MRLDRAENRYDRNGAPSDRGRKLLGANLLWTSPSAQRGEKTCSFTPIPAAVAAELSLDQPRSDRRRFEVQGVFQKQPLARHRERIGYCVCRDLPCAIAPPAPSRISVERCRFLPVCRRHDFMATRGLNARFLLGRRCQLRLADADTRPASCVSCAAKKSRCPARAHAHGVA